jgi:hypothetical protein
VLNYGFDDRNNRTARFAFLQRVYDTLAESGVFLLDVAGPDRAPVGSTKTFFEGEDWTVLVEVPSEGDVLSRRIVTYRRTDEHYRRDMELHKLHLISPQEVASDLRSVGFDVRQINQYDNQRLPRGLHGFMARKRSGDSRQSNVPDTLAATELGSNSVEGHGGQ